MNINSRNNSNTSGEIGILILFSLFLTIMSLLSSLIIYIVTQNNLCHELYNWIPGGLFYGDYSFPHQIINKGSEERLHLIIDLKNPKNLFTHIEKFSTDEIKRKKFKKIIIFFFNIFYKYPKKIFRLFLFKNN